MLQRFIVWDKRFVETEINKNRGIRKPSIQSKDYVAFELSIKSINKKKILHVNLLYY